MSENTTSAPPRRSMKKAVIAGALGLALLAGGGATFANWYENQNLGTGNIASGHLTLSAPVVTGSGWTVAHWNGTAYGSEVAIAAADLPNFKMVPGDRLTYTGTVEAKLQGNNLKANLTASTAGVTTSTFFVISTPTLTGATNPLAGNADGTEKTYSGIGVSLTITLPYSTGGDSTATPTPTGNGSDAEDTTLDLTKLKLQLAQIP